MNPTTTQPPLGPAALAQRDRIRFVDHRERARLGREFSEQRGLYVDVDTISAASRGHLRDAIDDAIERALAEHGAAAPRPNVLDGDADVLGDQLFRARQAGLRGLCVALGPLDAIAGVSRMLAPEDGAVLRSLSRATRDCPVWLLLDTTGLALTAQTEPVALERLLERDARDDGPRVPPRAPLTTPLDISAREDDEAAPYAGPRARPSETRPHKAALSPRTPAPPTVANPARARALGREVRKNERVSAPREDWPRDWERWTAALAEAHGTQPLAVFERLFVESYVPLGVAIEAGLDDPRALEAHDEFRHTFERGYPEACATFAITGRRPKMVLDAPDLAGRLARLHGARATQLLMVDSMRLDIGRAVKETLGALLGAKAKLADETLLFAALPATSARQLDTIGRGVDSLRQERSQGDSADDASVDGTPDSLRGRTAEIVRRVRAGRRDLFKLDLIPARRDQDARGAGGGAVIAEAVAHVIAKHTETLAPRTLLYVFGDHGFAFASPKNRMRVKAGASPEEVLVPAFAFLMGEVH